MILNGSVGRPAYPANASIGPWIAWIILWSQGRSGDRSHLATMLETRPRMDGWMDGLLLTDLSCCDVLIDGIGGTK